MEEYSIEWFRWHRQNNTKWLGTQALRLLEHYEQLAKALKYCYDDKVVMQNQIDVLVANNERLRGLFGDFDFFPTVEECEKIWNKLMEERHDLAR